MAEALEVYFEQRRVGTLTELSSGRMSFEYAPSWLDDRSAFGISLSLPLVPGLNAGDAAHAFFANLLPEGNLREAVARRLGLSVDNDFALLRALGGDCAGALSLLPGDHPTAHPGRYERLEPERIARMARRHSVLPDVIGSHRPRLSLAGAQDKLPVKVDEGGGLWLPLDGAVSTHILKVPSRDYKHLPVNEVLTTALARVVGLETARVELLVVEDQQLALIERYDRAVRDGQVARVHQEDLCQALGLAPSRKYEQEGGPSFAEVLKTVRAHSSAPLIDDGQLLRWLAFVLLAGNADAHGKNLSLLYAPPKQVRLAPFYDLVCTRVYERLDRQLAMAVGGQHDPGLVGGTHWEQLARDVGIGKRLVLSEVERLASTIPAAFEQVAREHAAQFGESPVIQRIQQALHKQCRRSLALLVR